jgi:two-component system NtrC family sensor kinase
VKRELLDHPLEPQARDELERFLGVMDRECIRCGEIVHNLLTFARRTGGDMESIDIGEIVERALMLVRHHLEISNIELHSELNAEDTMITADPGQVQQALLALLVNAVEAMPKDGERMARLNVELRGEPDFVEIEVRDTGVGIDPDVLPHIFEPFFSTKGAESGVGLGLAVVYGIINRHGGKIDVDSQRGRGTTFTIRLPRRPPDESMEDTAVPEEIARI